LSGLVDVPVRADEDADVGSRATQGDRLPDNRLATLLTERAGVNP
jgi:hypothetical protein